MSEQQRGSHPFHMYDAIRAQPEAWIRAVERNRGAATRIAATLASAESLCLIGIGTSYHAAQIGEFLFREYAPSVPVRAMHSFDFALYGPTLTAQSAVVAMRKWENAEAQKC